MKILFKSPGWCLGLLLFVAACSPRNQVSVSDTNLGDTIDVKQNLVFDFSHDLAPDSVLQKWDSTAFFTIQPEVKGLFKWNSARQLVFSPSAGFKPETDYTLHLSTALLKYTAGHLTLEATEYTIATEALKIQNVQTWWTLNPGSSEQLIFHASLNFNYEMNPEELKGKVNAVINGKSVTVKVDEQNSSANLQISAEGLTRADAVKGEFSITVTDGIKCVECSKGSRSLTYSGNIYPVTQLEFTSFETGFENGDGFIRLYTNQPVSMAGIEKLISLSPSPAYKIEQHESGITLRGAFSAGYGYEITVNRSLQGLLGGSMANDYYTTVSFGEQEPGIAFTNNKGMYLTSKGNRKIGIQIVNMPKVKVSVYKIYENNILAFMNSNRYNEWWNEEDGSGWVYNDYDLERYGNVVLSQEYNTRDLPKTKGMSLLSMNFDDEMPFRGIYLITAQSTENQWIKATKLVSVSDIGLIARTGSDEVMVFANSVKEASPLQRVTVSVISSNNQVLFSGATNGEGMVKFSGLQSKYKEFSPALITARIGNDFNYMLLSDTRVETSRFETGGYRENGPGYMAFIYGEREIYRPGEIIHSNVVVRDRKWKPLKNLPVKLRLLLPNGRELSTLRKTLNDQGASAQDFAIPSGAATGTYTIEVYSANDVLLTEKPVSVEEFMPDRISVKATTDHSAYVIGDTVKLTGIANNLFGTPATDRNYEVQFTLDKTIFSPKGYDDYNFNIRGMDHINPPSSFSQGKTNTNGEINDAMRIDPILRETGKLSGKAFVTVFDETGRPVNRMAAFEVITQRVFFGAKVSEYYAGIGQNVQVSMVALNPSGALIPSMAHVRIIKVDYHSVLTKSSGDRMYFTSQRQERLLQDKQYSLQGRPSLVNFKPTESGEYLVRIGLPGSDRYIEESFYAYGWGYTGSSSFAVNTEGTIDVTTDKASYQPGEKAKLLFKTPFNGRLLVTVEQNSVLNYYQLTTDKKAAELVLPISRDYLPNVYITATLFRKVDDGSIPLTVAHGVIPVTIEAKENKIPVTIKVAEKSRANTRQQITVKTTPSSDVEVTIAVVDEGILQLKNTKTPDPYNFFYQKRALMVDQYDIYPYLLPELQSRRSSTGGDGYSLAQRVNPITNKRVRLVSAWSGILHTNSAGIASYNIDIPSFSGDLRVMATAYKDQSFGSAEAHIKVADPVVISAALPRFTSPGDTVIVPVTFTNTTANPIQASAGFSATGAIRILTSGDNRLSLAAGKEQRLLCKVIAPSGTGEGSFTVKVVNGNENYSDKTEITVRPPASLQVRDGSGMIKGGTTAAIDLHTGFIASSAQAELIISKSPLVSFADQLSYLLDYPHGCAEQTISIAFPQIYYADLARSITNKPGYSINTQLNVQAAIGKVLSLQHYNGGIVTWEGTATANQWTSVYAAHFLSEAKKAGYAVNESGYNKLMEYISKQVKEKRTEEVRFYDGNNTYVKAKRPAKDIFYALYVLAMNNKADRSTMNHYRSRFTELSLDSKYLLAGTYLAIGDRRTYDDLLPKAFAGERAEQCTGGSFYSYVRDMAITLNTLITQDPDNEQVGLLVKQLSGELKKSSWLNTQERALSFLALGKFSRLAAQSTVTAAIETDGGKKFNFDGKDLVLRKEVVNANITVKASGSGNLYYFWKSRGLTSDGSYKQEDKNLRVRKTFYNRSGQEIPGNQFRQNDLIVVKISLENLSREFVENVVVTDMLPAGFEIENPRISTIPDLDWIKNNHTPEYIDIRDDRINFYCYAATQPQYFYYVVRAVSPGNYVMGPVSADAMYSGEYHSIYGSGRVLVKQ
ncbi:MAG: MG2 domain-containing protein [Bacteroidia bacterium]